VAESREEIREQGKRPAIGVGAENAFADDPDEQRHQEQAAGQQDEQEDELASAASVQNTGVGHGRGHNSRKMQKIRAAVIGVGYLGRFHAQKYAQAQDCELVAVVDARPEAREAVARELGTQALNDYRELIGRVDAVSVVTPTPAHFEIARNFLDAGVHVLVEKPITETPAEARELIALARTRQRLLQVGHLERFNAAILAAEPYLTAPRFIECHRLAPYKERGTDVNVVLDLMIHDIDIVQTIVGAPIASIDAIGTKVFSDEIDIANARIRFENGCVANATASRVSMKTERKMRVFEDDAYLSLDLQQKILTLIRKRSGPMTPGQLPVTIEEQSLDQGDALKAEIESFLECIRTGRAPVVGGEAGLRALETAMRITEQVNAGVRAR
jgi:predicted dehydrogenase